MIAVTRCTGRRIPPTTGEGYKNLEFGPLWLESGWTGNSSPARSRFIPRKQSKQLVSQLTTRVYGCTGVSALPDWRDFDC